MQTSVTSMTRWMLAVMMVLTTSVGLAQAPEFCWRDSTTRGVGTVPVECAPGWEQIGLLCYESCPKGYARSGLDCRAVCPEGMRDDGLFCRAAEYGRGAGYPWKFSDGLNLDGARDRCAKDPANPQGCEQNGAVIYPKCAPGYENFGCCTCRPPTPTCGTGKWSDMNSAGQVDLSCQKKTIFTGKSPATGLCPNQDKDGGLCYPKCPEGYTGVGPVCWGKAPPGWGECGMGAAKDTATCVSTIASQVWAPIANVGQIAILIGSLGTSATTSQAANTGTAAKVLADMKAKYEQLKAAYDKAKAAMGPTVALMEEVALGANKARTISVNLNKATAPDITSEDIARYSAEIAAVFDPTGTAATVAAFTYPKCSKYFPANSNTAQVSVPRSLTQLYDREVWVLSKEGDIYRWNGAQFDVVPGKLTSIAVGDREVWGINQNNDVYWWNGKGFDYVPGTNSTNNHMKSIVVVDGEVWAESLYGHQWFRWSRDEKEFLFRYTGGSFAVGGEVSGTQQIWGVGGYAQPQRLVENKGWEDVKVQAPKDLVCDKDEPNRCWSPAAQFKSIAVGDRDAWAIDAQGFVYRWDQTTLQLNAILPLTRLDSISVSDQEVWGLNDRQQVFRWNGTKFDPVHDYVDKTRNVELTSIQVADAEVWGINKDQDVVRWDGQKFEKIPIAVAAQSSGKFASVALGH